MITIVQIAAQAWFNRASVLVPHRGWARARFVARAVVLGWSVSVLCGCESRHYQLGAPSRVTKPERVGDAPILSNRDHAEQSQSPDGPKRSEDSALSSLPPGSKTEEPRGLSPAPLPAGAGGVSAPLEGTRIQATAQPDTPLLLPEEHVIRLRGAFQSLTGLTCRLNVTQKAKGNDGAGAENQAAFSLRTFAGVLELASGSEFVDVILTGPGDGEVLVGLSEDPEQVENKDRGACPSAETGWFNLNLAARMTEVRLVFP